MWGFPFQRRDNKDRGGFDSNYLVRMAKHTQASMHTGGCLKENNVRWGLKSTPWGQNSLTVKEPVHVFFLVSF